MKVTEFRGINNVADITQLAPGELARAENVEIDTRGMLHRRRGRTLRLAGGAHSPHESPFGLMVVLDNDLVLLNSSFAVARTLYPTLGYTRVWYANLPDGRVAFSNGLIAGLVTATTTTALGVSAPVDAGVGAVGETPYAVTYVRLADGREGPPTYGLSGIDPEQAVIGLPRLDGHRINVYLAPHGALLLAGSTDTDSFTHAGGQLGVELDAAYLDVPPVGTQLTVWGSRLLIADGKTLWGCAPFRPEVCNLGKDFLQFDENITLLFGVEDGLFVGTQSRVWFLAGTAFDTLQARVVASAGAALGSCVVFDSQYLNEKARPRGSNRVAACLIGDVLHVLGSSGICTPLTADRYRFAASEVWASVRLKGGALQYIAAPA